MTALSQPSGSRMPRRAGGTVEYINPEGMLRNPAFTQAVAVTGPVKIIYVGAQTAVDGSGRLIGKGDVAAQTEQVLSNIETCLRTAGAGPEHIVKWNIYLAEGQPIDAAFQASMRWWGGRPNPPTNSVMYVSGFPLLPDVLLMIDAVAVLPA